MRALNMKPLAEIGLGDKVAAAVRHVRRDDAQAVQQFIRGLSPASRYMRFMMGIRELPPQILERFIAPAAGREAVLVASIADGTRSGLIIGIAQYAADAGSDDCEFAIVVADAFQRQGWGRRLLVRLGCVAVRGGIRRAHADMLADNEPMRRLAQKLGCKVRVNPEAHFMSTISRALAQPCMSVPDSARVRSLIEGEALH
jgi:acetyltransferase